MKKHTIDLARKLRRTLTLESLESRTLLAASFLAPAEPSGSLEVQFVPVANVTAGVQEIVTFGVPFTRGSVTAEQLSRVRVLKHGVEIPAFVEQLTPWRSIDDPGLDGKSVRVARIQIPYTFASLAPESVTVQWGGPARTLVRPTMQDPRLEWHTVNGGTFAAADAVEEPDVLPLLPKAHLAKGVLDARTVPTADGVTEGRDDPAVMDAMTFPGYTEFDHAQKNFFYTILNQNLGIIIDYKTQSEPWLYDRSSAMYGLYLRSGSATALREAIRATDFYADRINPSGYFTLKPGDPKYAYNESLAYTYWLLGDNRMLTPISTVVAAHSGTPSRWNPGLSFWTERNVGYKFLANEIAYEVTGMATFEANVQTIVEDLLWHQNGAGGQLPGNRIDGGLYHTGGQHDASEVGDPSVLIASPWMSALVVDPMVRVYAAWQNPLIADFLVRMGNFVKVASKTDTDGQFGGTTRYPDYLMRANGISENRTESDVQHAMDVGAVAAWATYFAELRGTPDATLRQLANDLYATYDVGVNFWTRPGGTNYNVSPPRRYNWEYKNSSSFSWALTGSDSPGLPGSLQFGTANLTVNETQGTATITVTRTGGSAGSVSVGYATGAGTATAGSDFTATTGTLTFADGEVVKTFAIPIVNDSLVEGDETVTLSLSNPAGGAALTSPATAVLTIVSEDTSNQPATVTFQQGVNNYTGTTDVSITNQYAQYTGGNGNTAFSDSQLGVFQTTGTGSYTIESLIRFGNLALPTTATVSAATLTLTVDTYAANPSIRGYYLLSSWSGNPGDQLGWVHRGTGQDWAVPGALGQGTDVEAGRSFLVGGIVGNGGQTITIHLDPAVVQGWVANPGSNQGILLVNETTGAVVRVNASENAAAATRPRLAVTYTTGTPIPQPGALQFSAAAHTANETQGTATVTVTRTGGSDGTVTVNYATGTGTATAGNDFTATSGTLTFGPGVTTRTFTITITNDALVEPDETVPLSLTAPTGGATLGTQAAATLTIVSDDTSGQPTTATFQQGVNGYAGTTDVNISTQYAQYTGGNGTTSFTASQLGVYQIAGSNGYKMESLIRFDNLSVPANAMISNATLTLRVETYSASPVVRGHYLLAPWSSTPGPSTTQLGWMHRGTGQDWAVPGALGQGTDVEAGRSFLVGGIAGNGGQTITIHLNPAVVQGWVANPGSNQGILLVNETTGAVVRVNASENAAAATRPRLAVTYTTGTPIPQPGALQFSAAAFTANETQGTATVTVTRTGGSDGTVTVNYATGNGTATAGNDFTATSGTLTFGPGVTTRTFTVPLLDDLAVEGNETLQVTLGNPTGGATLGGQASATIAILDNDAPAPVGSFTNVTQASGVGAIVAQKYQQTPNWWLSGQHLVDLDADGDLDLYLSNHGGGSVVALNDGLGNFTRATSGSFPDSEIHQMYDIDEDGKVDLSMTYLDGGGRWWVNESSPGAVNYTATEITRGGNTSRSQVMFDFDGDGKVDWLRSAPPGLVVDLGNGAGGFTEGSYTFVVPGTTSNDNASFLPADFDADGDTDLLVLTGGNYDGTPGKTSYWRNNGNRTFTDVTSTSGIPANGTLAKGIGDFDQDGDTDFIALENRSMPPVIYSNTGLGVFVRKPGAVTGVATGTLDYTFWGTAVATDFDNDGIVDILMHGKYYLKALRGTGDGNFTSMNAAWGIRDVAASAVDDGLGFGDFDSDGDLDIIGYDEIWPTKTLSVYRNDLAQGHWLNVRPVGLSGNRGATGAKIRIYAAGTNQLLWYEQVAAYDFQVATSYYGYGETERHFGLGDRTVVDVVVEFSGSGRVTRIANVAANQTIRVLETPGGT